jgi:hypothetical protein
MQLMLGWNLLCSPGWPVVLGLLVCTTSPRLTEKLLNILGCLDVPRILCLLFFREPFWFCVCVCVCVFVWFESTCGYYSAVRVSSSTFLIKTEWKYKKARKKGETEQRKRERRGN